MDTLTRHNWWSEIRRRARARDIQRELHYNHVRKAALGVYFGARLRGRFPVLVPEFLQGLAGAAIGFWLIAVGLSWLGARPVYTYAVLALVFSLQATYYKQALARDANFRIKRCNCAGARRDSSESVLTSSASTLLGIPSSALGALLYGALIVLLFLDHPLVALVLAALALLASVRFSYVMLSRIKGLCSLCINVAALSGLIVWQLV